MQAAAPFQNAHSQYMFRMCWRPGTAGIARANTGLGFTICRAYYGNMLRFERGLMDTENVNASSQAVRQFLRHILATIAYRGGKALRGAPAGFGEFHASETTRTPGQILAHVGDLLDWALSQVSGKEKWSDSKPLAWEDGGKRFFSSLQALDDYLASDSALGCTPEKLFQGALADALTHIGQISMLRRLAGSHVRAENYSRADIVTGRVGSGQTPPSKEFN